MAAWTCDIISAIIISLFLEIAQEQTIKFTISARSSA